MRFYLLVLCLLLLTMACYGRKNGFRKRKRGRCRDALGMETGVIPDSALSASSSHTSLEPKYSRLRITGDTGGGAWCPQGLVTADSYTYLQIDFHRLMTVTRIETQGRDAQGEGREFTDGYRLEYQRQEGEPWRRFYHKEGHEILQANTDTGSSVHNDLYPPIITRRLRVIPAPSSPKAVCLRLEVYGCDWEDKLLAYNVSPKPQSYPMTSKRQILLTDDLYDGQNNVNSLKNGLGKLTDYENGNSRWNKRGSPFLAWRKTPGKPLTFAFEFEGVRNFSQMAILGVADKRSQIDFFKSAQIECGYDGTMYLAQSAYFMNTQVTVDLEAVAITVYLKQKVCRWLRVTLDYRDGMEWILLSEVYFMSEPASEDFIIPIITTTSTAAPTQATDQLQPNPALKSSPNTAKNPSLTQHSADNKTVFVVLANEQVKKKPATGGAERIGAFTSSVSSILVVFAIREFVRYCFSS